MSPAYLSHDVLLVLLEIVEQIHGTVGQEHGLCQGQFVQISLDHFDESVHFFYYLDETQVQIDFGKEMRLLRFEEVIAEIGENVGVILEQKLGTNNNQTLSLKWNNCLTFILE